MAFVPVVVPALSLSASSSTFAPRSRACAAVALRRRGPAAAAAPGGRRAAARVAPLRCTAAAAAAEEQAEPASSSADPSAAADDDLLPLSVADAPENVPELLANPPVEAAVAAAAAETAPGAAAADADSPVVAADASATTVASVDDDAAAAETDAPKRRAAGGGSSTTTSGTGMRRAGSNKQKRTVTLKLEDMTPGMELEGTVKSTTAYGAFIGDMGTPTDGLLHVSQLADGFVENVTDVVQSGSKVKVRVLSVDLEKGNFSLTMKTPRPAGTDGGAQGTSSSAGGGGTRRGAGSGGGGGGSSAAAEKWKSFTFNPETYVGAKVVSVADFGAFCKILNEAGEEDAAIPTDGLIHISELSEGRVTDVASVLAVDQVVKVRITGADRKRNRISLSLREFKVDESATLAEDMAANSDKQPQFKTTMELAFERAKPRKL